MGPASNLEYSDGREEAPTGADARLARWLRWAVDVRPAEVRALGWSWLYILAVMCSYSILRPVRDEVGAFHGIEKLPWLFLGTLGAMIAINPAFAWLVARLPRRRFITIAYRFFALNLLVFAALLQFTATRRNFWIDCSFFVWTSVFNLFVVSVFWALVVDVFDSAQGKRLFGFIAAGATLGAIVGSSVTASLATRVPPVYLLIGSALLLELAVLCVRRLSRLAEALVVRPSGVEERGPVGGSVLAGLTRALGSPYLIGVSLYMLLYTVTSTFLYFQQVDIAGRTFADRGSRTSFFATVDLLTNSLTLVTQLFLTGRIIRAVGVAATLTVLPALSMVGFGTLAAVPTIWVLVAYQVLRRAGNFSLARPAREVLFTVVPREDKYKAKSFIDTVVYRAGDQVGAWSYAGLAAAGLGMTGISVIAVPLSVVWLGIAWWLGRKQESIARRGEAAPDAIPLAAAK